MKTKKKSDASVLFDMRVKLLRSDGDLLAYLHEDAARNQRTVPAQVRYMLRRQMQAAQEQNDGR